MNDLARKRLKRKVLDRWENEGGRLCDPPPASAGAGASCDPDGQISADNPPATNDDIYQQRDTLELKQ